MRQELGQFYSVDQDVDVNPPRRSSTLRDEPSGSDSNEWNPIDTSGEAYRFYRHSGEERSDDSRISKESERFWTSQNDEEHKENNRESRGEESSRKTYVQKPDGFEPFINQEPQENNLFVNNYGGNYAQKMELNRRWVERALQIAHLEGKVFLTNLQSNRSRAEAHGNELVAKRFLFFGEKTQKAEEENRLKRVMSIPEGWRIEINDQRITEELTEKRLGGERLQKAFIGEFNGLVKEGIR